MASLSSISAVTSPAVLWMLAILGLSLWMLFRPQGKDAPKILLLILFFAFEPFSVAVMNAENRAFPLKFDHFLYFIDKSLGLSAFWVARLLPEWQRSILFTVYQSLTAAMIAWYGVNLRRRDGRPAGLLVAYMVTFALGPCLYLIVPACGPRHAFGSAFPAGNPDVSLLLVPLNHWPNAIPSLHVSTALLFVFFSGRSRWLAALAVLYLAATVVATLAFEHYVIDLVVAVPFACCATFVARGRARQALCCLAGVLVWLLAIRFATPALTAHPALLRIPALVTVLSAAAGMTARPGVPEGSQSSTIP
jgi:PAP2 superfamily